jgi:hypothetical protein
MKLNRRRGVDLLLLPPEGAILVSAGGRADDVGQPHANDTKDRWSRVMAMTPVNQTEVDSFVRALRVVLNQAQELIAAGETGALLSNRISLAVALTRQLSRVIELDERDTAMEYGAAIAAVLFPLGTSFYEVEDVPVSVDPEGTNARAWDIPGSRHFPLPLGPNAEPLSEEDFLCRVDALLNP